MGILLAGVSNAQLSNEPDARRIIDDFSVCFDLSEVVRAAILKTRVGDARITSMGTAHGLYRNSNGVYTLETSSDGKIIEARPYFNHPSIAGRADLGDKALLLIGPENKKIKCYFTTSGPPNTATFYPRAIRLDETVSAYPVMARLADKYPHTRFK